MLLFKFDKMIEGAVKKKLFDNLIIKRRNEMANQKNKNTNQGTASKATKAATNVVGKMSLWERIKLFFGGIFSAEVLRTTIEAVISSEEGRETLKEIKVGAFGLNSGDERVYEKIKYLFNDRQKMILGKFGEEFEKSDKDFDRFRCFVAEIHNDFLEDNKRNPNINLKDSPAYAILAGVVRKHKEGFPAQMTFVGRNLAKDELGIKKTYQASKKPMKATVVVVSALVFGTAFILFGGAIVALLVLNFRG
jgi:hypothetical protein